MKVNKKVITISFGHFVHDIYTSFLAPILPLLIENLKISYFQAGLLQVIKSFPAAFNVFVGLWADRKDLRYLVIISPSITGILMSIIGIAPSYTALVLMLLGVGISATLFHVPTPVMIRAISSEKRLGLGMSMFMLGGELARTVGPLIIIGAVSLWGFQGAYRLIPLSILTSVLLWWQSRNIIINQGDNSKKPKVKIKVFLREHARMFVMITGFMLFSSLMKSALSFFLPTFKNTQGESLWLGGINLAIFQLSGAVGTFLSGTLSDKFGRKRILLAAALINPFLMLIFVKFQHSVTSTVLLVMMGLSIISYGSVLLAIVQEVKTDRPAFLNSIYMTINFIISSIGAITIGLLSDIFSMEITFYIAAVAAFFSIPFLLFLPFQKAKVQSVRSVTIK